MEMRSTPAAQSVLRKPTHAVRHRGNPSQSIGLSERLRNFPQIWELRKVHLTTVDGPPRLILGLIKQAKQVRATGAWAGMRPVCRA